MNTLIVLFTAASVQFDLPPNLLESLCYVESKHDVTAVHHDDGGSDSLGVCQIKFSTAQWLGFKGTAKDLMKPAINIQYAAKYLSRNIKRYGGQVEKGVIAYNIGHAGNLQRTVYSEKVIQHWRDPSNRELQEKNSDVTSALFRLPSKSLCEVARNN